MSCYLRTSRWAGTCSTSHCSCLLNVPVNDAVRNGSSQFWMSIKWTSGQQRGRKTNPCAERKSRRISQGRELELEDTCGFLDCNSQSPLQMDPSRRSSALIWTPLDAPSKFPIYSFGHCGITVEEGATSIKRFICNSNTNSDWEMLDLEM